MEFKYFGFYKSISNFATNLVGVFLPLLVYEYTGLFYVAIIYYIAQYILNIVFANILKKHIYSKPQLLLLIRIIPFVLYSVCIMLLEINVMLIAIPLCICYSLNVAMSVPCEEIILNYSSEENYSEHLGISDFLTYLFASLSIIAGGYILDNISPIVLTIISVSLYAISLIPLVMFYVKNRKKTTFNKELTTNAVELDKNHLNKHKTKLTLVTRYCVTLGLIFCIDASYALVSLLVYTKFELFTISAIIYGLSDLLYGVASLIIGKWNEVKDLGQEAKYACIVSAILIVAIPFIQNQIVLMLMVCVLSILEPIIIVFVSDKMIQKTRVVGVSNSALFHYTNSFYIMISITLLFGITGNLIPSFIVSGLGTFTAGMIINKNEEDTNEILINYLDSVETGVMKKRKRKKAKIINKK